MISYCNICQMLCIYRTVYFLTKFEWYYFLSSKQCCTFMNMGIFVSEAKKSIHSFALFSRLRILLYLFQEKLDQVCSMGVCLEIKSIWPIFSYKISWNTPQPSWHRTKQTWSEVSYLWSWNYNYFNYMLGIIN